MPAGFAVAADLDGFGRHSIQDTLLPPKIPKLVDGIKAGVYTEPDLARLFKASCKLDATDWDKVHAADSSTLGTRLVLGGCWVCTSITWAFACRLLTQRCTPA